MIKKIALLAIMCIGTSVSASLGSDVREALSTIYHTIKENHPGPCDPENPFFMIKMRLGYAWAYVKSFGVTTQDDAERVLKNFVESFDDPHTSVHVFQLPKKRIRKKFVQDELVGDITWVSLPTFSNLNQEQEKDFKAVCDLLESSRSKKAIVIDLSNNGGGDSAYGLRVINALFGRDYAEFIHYKTRGNEVVDWRVSSGNKDRILSFGDSLEIVQGMENALRRGECYYREIPVWKEKIVTKRPFNPCFAPLFIIISPINFSSSLLFLDEVTQGAQQCMLVGEITNVHTNYRECCSVLLPRVGGVLIFPIKVIRNSIGKNGQRYDPDCYVYCLGNDEKTKKEVLEYVNEMLESKAD